MQSLSFLLLSICLSSGMSASLVVKSTREEGAPPAVKTTFRVDTSAPGVDDTPAAEAVAEALVADTAVPDEVVFEEPVEDIPVADAPVDAPAMAEENEALVTEAMIKELSAQFEDEDLAEETEIQDAILKGLADQEAIEKAVEEPVEEEAAEAPAEDPASSVIPAFKAQEEDSGWGLASIRESLQAANGYFDSLFDIGIPAMTQCCNQLDSCYDTCGSNKYRCDSKYRWCLHAICSDLKKSLGFVSKTVADGLYNTVWTLGCRSFMNSQRGACYCEGEERDEL
ncbi:unnamed protein product, partial [Coregonus sp. 'balchen']